MKIKPNYIVIPLVVIVVAVLGSLATSANLGWYNTLKLPSVAPPGQVIGTIWTVLYVLIVASALIFWNRANSSKYFRLIVAVFLLNAYFNAFWSFTFFSFHMIFLSLLVSGVMALTIFTLIGLIYPRQRTAALLLIPYGVWVIIATYLNYLIWVLNRTPLHF